MPRIRTASGYARFLSGLSRKFRPLPCIAAFHLGANRAQHGGFVEAPGWADEIIGRGVAADLLDMLERLMRGRGISAIEAEASPNALAFYLRRGYRENGPRSANGAWPIAKTL